MADPDDLPTEPETPSAKRVAATHAWRTAIVEVALTSGLAWAAWRGHVSWDAFGGWVATVVMTQVMPRGTAIESAVRALVMAIGKASGRARP